VGSKPVIVGSLAAMIVVGLVLLTLSGVPAFWICGLLLCLFVGPTLASARALMLRMSAEGKEGVAFGLYTTAGRAASFLALDVLHLHRPTGPGWVGCARCWRRAYWR
jgi:UMF1 family MFS transporter